MHLPYHKLGSGTNILLAFHGIEQDGLSCFKPFEETLGQHYTIYAFDLFFHGQHKSADIELVTKISWKEQIQRFLVQNNIQHFDIAGFSLGGRFALATLESFPELVENVFLIAPDGVSEHPLYNLATRFKVTRRLFRWTMEKPAAFFAVVNVMKSLKLLNSSLVRFTEQVLNTPEKRQIIYRSWTAFSPLRFDIPQLYEVSIQNHIHIFLITGKYDKLLKPASVEKLAKLLPADQHIQLKTGHSQLVAQAATWICTLFR
ncbi:alpha/beta fold hydrolase [Dyadobacter luticola]|uniref:Alpha/beta hydrolase n=1 Tax=Dyadobacter luticola TaxID=1979387 RepID=A0A5R9KVE5_9BACT|nr:alpha/beta fold hydrolase [Dyadobacter luticola]TLV00120.1 alpha/beta hydrolase [Dyadobacter luticola]